MHVLMFGVNDSSPTFIHRQVAFARAAGVTVTVWGGVKGETVARKAAQWMRVKTGFPMGLSAEQLRQARTADVFHFQWSPDMFQNHALARMFGKATVFSLRGTGITIMPHQPGQERYSAQLRATLPRMSAYHGVSAAILREGEAFGVVIERARVVYTAVDLDFFVPPAQIAPDPTRIVMVGSLLPVKGYAHALNALHRLRALHGMTPRLTIVGEGEARADIEAQIDALALRDQVTLMGRLAPDGVCASMHEAGVFLHSAVNEGIANVAVEAMACGLPVVTTDVGGMGEAITDGIEGFLVPARDPDGTAAALARLLGDDDLRARMGLAARARAVRQFSPDRQGREFAALYAFAVENEHARRATWR